MLLLHVYSSDALGTGYEIKSSMSPFGDLRYGIRYLCGLRFFISGPNELTEPKFNTHSPKDLCNFIKKFFWKNLIFSCKDSVTKKRHFFNLFTCLFWGISDKKSQKKKVTENVFKLLWIFFRKDGLKKMFTSPSTGCPKNISHSFSKFYEFYWADGGTLSHISGLRTETLKIWSYILFLEHQMTIHAKVAPANIITYWYIEKCHRNHCFSFDICNFI